MASNEAQQLEQVLRDLPQLGTLVKDRGYRQVWQFRHGGKGYFLKFYPHAGARLKRVFRGSPAMREFRRLQWLQKAGVPAPRAVAALMGFHVSGVKGDAVLMEAIEPAVQLDHYLNEHELAAQPVPNHRQLVSQVIELVYKLGQAKLGHTDLHLGNFLLSGDKVYLLDAYAVRDKGLRLRDIMHLGHSAQRYATTSDLQRGWRALGSGARRMPRSNLASPRLHRKVLERAASGSNRYFGSVSSEGWSGVCFRYHKAPHRWSPASQLIVSEDDWARQWPILLRQIEAGKLTRLKSTRSGEVLAGEVTLGGRVQAVIVKRPRRRYWYRYVNEIGRGARARRAWFKAWNMIVRNIPTAWPLLLMEKRKLGYVVDQVIVFERVAGVLLEKLPLNEVPANQRDMLFRRVGRILRQIERYGFSHFDAKSSNWMVIADERRGRVPVLIDIDGIRARTWVALGIQRLLRSMRSHPQYSVADSLALCQGYAPTAVLHQEDSDAEQAATEQSKT